MAKPHFQSGVIHASEAYSKHELLARLGVSQKVWDRMLDEGLPYSQLGKSRWVRGQDLIDYFQRTSQKKEA